MTILVAWSSLIASSCTCEGHAQGPLDPGARIARNTPEPPSPGRVYRSDDEGRSWQRSDGGLVEAAIVVDFATSDDDIYAATEAEGIWASRDRGSTWRATGLGAERITAIAADARIVVAGSYERGVFVSRDRGATWTPIHEGLRDLHVRRIVIADQRVFVATNAGLHLSDDGASTFRHVVGTLQVKGVAVVANSVFMGDIDGVHRSDDDGMSFRHLLKGTPHNVNGGQGTVYALLYDGRVMRSEDSGANWQDASAGLPPQYTFQILEHAGSLYAAQWDGVHVWAADERRWQAPGDGLPPQLSATDLVALPGGRLLAATVPRAGRDWDKPPAPP